MPVDPVRANVERLLGKAARPAKQQEHAPSPTQVGARAAAMARAPREKKAPPPPPPLMMPGRVLKRDRFKEDGITFDKPSDPFRTSRRKPKEKVKVEVITDETREFRSAIMTPLNEGQIKWRNIPLLGSPGSAKTSRAITIAKWIGDHYGWENTNIVMSDDLMALAGGMDKRPVQVLIVDDALRKFQSRGGTTKEQVEAIGKFVELRHELEDILAGKVSESGKTEGHIEMTQSGIVFCLFTAQLYKGLEKTFRDGLVVFCSTLVEDRETIMQLFTNKCSDTGMRFVRANAAWGFLEEKTYAIEMRGEEKEKRWAIAALPMIGPSIIQIPWYKSICMNPKCKAEDQSPKKPCTKCKGKVGFEPEGINPDTGKPYIRRVFAPPKETEKERLNRLSTVYDYVAAKFMESGGDPTKTHAKALLNVWLREFCSRIGTNEVEDPVLRSTDWMVLVKKSTYILEHAIRLKRLRADKEQMEQAARLAAEGTERVTNDDLVDHVRDEWLKRLVRMGVEPGEPRTKEYLKEFIRERWRHSPTLRDRIMGLNGAIFAAACYKWDYGGGRPEKPENDEGGSSGEPASSGNNGSNEVVGAKKEVTPPQRVELGPQFTFDIDAYLPKLIPRQVARRDAAKESEKEALAKWQRWVLTYKLREREGIGQPTVQREWEKHFGVNALRPYSNEPWGADALVAKRNEHTGDVEPPFVQRTLGNWVSYVESALGDALGESYEVWVAEQLRAGWRPSWLKGGMRVKAVTHGGAQSHTPDIKVEYENGDVDWVSLKCYNNREYITINIAPQDGKHGHVQPEVNAVRSWTRKDPLHEHRLVVMVRDIGASAMEVFAAYREDEFPESVRFNHHNIGTPMQNVWRPPLPSEPRPVEDDAESEGGEEGEVCGVCHGHGYVPNPAKSKANWTVYDSCPEGCPQDVDWLVEQGGAEPGSLEDAYRRSESEE